MPIPDKTIFGPHISENRGITFGEVRQLSNDDIKIEYLRKRFEGYFVDQVDPISDREKVYSPFPLTVLTCIGVETLGRVFFDVEALVQDERKKKEISKLVSIPIYGFLDARLTRQLSKEFKTSMQTIWPNDNVKNISNYAELLHSYLRTSFVHGYRGKNVFLSAELETGWEFDSGSLIINPYWFWNQYKRVFQDCFIKISDKRESNNPNRRNALKYFNRILNE